MKVGIVHWQREDEIAGLVASSFEELGCETINFFHNAPPPDEADVICACGPFGSLVPLAGRLLARPVSRRPLFVLWMTEQLGHPDLPEFINYPVSALRSGLERMAFGRSSQGRTLPVRGLRWFTTKAKRGRYYGDLHWLRSEGILSLLVVGSMWISRFLRDRGIESQVGYIGSHPDWGADMGLERDIPVLWLGRVATRRRRRNLDRIRSELKNRGIEILVKDGETSPHVKGQERTALLNRTRIVLNILRTPWDNHSLRYFLAVPNRVLVVSEPTYPHLPLQPGKHFVEAPINKMTEAICHYLDHEEDRQKIVDLAHRLVTGELTMKRSVAQIIDRINELGTVRNTSIAGEQPTG